jgi:hypothetical protein
LDIALQEYGTARAVLALALANGLDATDALFAGQVLALPVDAPVDRDMVAYYRSRKIRPATARPMMAEEDLQEWFGSLPGMLPYLLS